MDAGVVMWVAPTAVVAVLLMGPLRVSLLAWMVPTLAFTEAVRTPEAALSAGIGAALFWLAWWSVWHVAAQLLARLAALQPPLASNVELALQLLGFAALFASPLPAELAAGAEDMTKLAVEPAAAVERGFAFGLRAARLPVVVLGLMLLPWLLAPRSAGRGGDRTFAWLWLTGGMVALLTGLTHMHRIAAAYATWFTP